MSDTRDERPLEQIQFAIDELDVEKRAVICSRVRLLLWDRAHVRIAHNITQLGCTGLVLKLARPTGIEGDAHNAVAEAQYIRSHMDGSLCGLPCYVPPNRFCLVHNGIGALQLIGNVDGPQRNPHPEGVALCSRELTEDERKQVGGMDALINEHLKKDALVLGLEVDDDTAMDFNETADVANDVPAHIVNSVRLTPRFRCPEHNAAEPEWRCRFCLAAAVIAGPFEPECVVNQIDSGAEHDRFCADYNLKEVLGQAEQVTVELYVRAAVWQRKLVREG